MERDRWERIEQLYHAALEREPQSRDAFLDEACDGDEALRREVSGLLACDIPSDGFIQSPAIEIAARAMAADPLIEASNKSVGSLMTGSQIGAYRLLEPLGRGGMGEVHLALDTRLNRKVAIKFLPVEFTTDAGRVRRFAQEARAASALNHPNIITIHEIGETDSTHYIVTEFVEGETLRQRLTNTQQIPLKLPETIGLAAQIAAALATAHGAGIIHRDIKPENVMVRRDGIVKVLDFGLAKLTEPSMPAVNTQDATLARNRTDSGVVVGTPRYMSPEQARGEKVDARTDIFSLGVALYELLAGRAPFTGATARDCIAAILKDEPPELSETNQRVTPQLEKIVRRCLEKNPERRFQSASDLCFALEALSTPSGSRLESMLDTEVALPAVTENVAASSVRKRERLAWMATVALLLGILGFVWTYLTRRLVANDAWAMRFSILPPENSSFDQIAVSPDGRHLAFTAATGGKVQLWVQSLDSTEARPLPGTQGAQYPFWSPDSRFIGFFTDYRLKKIEVTGGTVQSLCEAPDPYGGAWSRDGVILFSQAAYGLWRVSATGGEVTQVTPPDISRKESNHFFPTFLPDGRHFLYVIHSGRKETRGVYLGSLDGTLKRRLLDNFTPVKYMPAVPRDTASGAGYLVFERDGVLLARPFDARRLDFNGEPFQISDKLGRDLVGVYPTFSASDNGMLVFDPSLKQRRRRQYRWVDRRGQPISLLDMPTGLYNHLFSPDEKRFITDRLDPLTFTTDLWLYDLSGGKEQRFTFNPEIDICPVWSPDGNSIVWVSNRDMIPNLYQKAASGAGNETLLLKSDYINIPTDWSRDGRFIVYYQIDPKTKPDVWVLPMTRSGAAKPFPVVQTEANEGAGTLSPDGRWLAYISDESGRYEVYVQSFPDGGGKRQVSTGGGDGPRWRRDGRELF